MKTATTALLLLLAGSQQAAAVTLWKDGAEIDITYDTAQSKIQFDVNVPKDQYLCIGLTAGMTNVDMVYFKGSGEGEVLDLWSPQAGIPTTDTSQDWDSTIDASDPSVYKFKSLRALSTGDSTEDSIIECGTTVKYGWAGNT